MDILAENTCIHSSTRPINISTSSILFWRLLCKILWPEHMNDLSTRRYKIIGGEHLPKHKSNESTTTKVFTKMLICGPRSHKRWATLILNNFCNVVKVMFAGLDLLSFFIWRIEICHHGEMEAIEAKRLEGWWL